MIFSISPIEMQQVAVDVFYAVKHGTLQRAADIFADVFDFD